MKLVYVISIVLFICESYMISLPTAIEKVDTGILANLLSCVVVLHMLEKTRTDLQFKCETAIGNFLSYE